MDLTEIFSDPRARARRAEALRVIHTGIRGAVPDWARSAGLYLGQAARLAYDEARRVATNLLFEEYASIAFEREPDAEVFIGFLPEIQRRVDVDLQVEYDGEKPEYKGRKIVRIDLLEARSCRLEWEQKAWERPKPSASQFPAVESQESIWQRFIQLFRRGSDSVAVAHPAPEKNDMGVPSLAASSPVTPEEQGDLPRSMSAAEALTVINTAMRDKGMTFERLADDMRPKVRKLDPSNKVEKSAINGVLKGETKQPHPAIKKVLPEMFDFSAERVKELKRALGWN